MYGQIDEDFYPRNYGSRTAAAKHDVVLLTNSAIRLNQGSSGVRDDWIVIEPGAAAGGGLSDGVPDPTPTPASSAVPVALAEAPATAAPPAAHSVDTAKEQRERTDAQSTRSAADMEKRLEALKQLRERELISEDVYQSKIKEILQDL